MPEDNSLQTRKYHYYYLVLKRRPIQLPKLPFLIVIIRPCLKTQRCHSSITWVTKGCRCPIQYLLLRKGRLQSYVIAANLDTFYRFIFVFGFQLTKITCALLKCYTYVQRYPKTTNKRFVAAKRAYFKNADFAPPPLDLARSWLRLSARCIRWVYTISATSDSRGRGGRG